jgi:hypothetical protein
VSRFLDAHHIEVRDRIPASRKLGESDAGRLVRESSEIYVARGKKLEHLVGGNATAEIVGKLLGPTGNLRSPTLRIGNALVVGFYEETLEALLL